MNEPINITKLASEIWAALINSTKPIELLEIYLHALVDTMQRKATPIREKCGCLRWDKYDPCIKVPGAPSLRHYFEPCVKHASLYDL